MKLSILIATMPIRATKLESLLSALNRQIMLRQDVEVIIDISMLYNIGTKRNKLLEQAKGDYIVFADDDDSLAYNYVEKILEAIESGPDCIGISGVITTNGKNEKPWHISKDYGHWYEANGVYYRTPNHISPVRRELALAAGFPEIQFGEDAEYSRRLLPMLKTEVKIPGILYYYRYVSHK